MSEKKIRKPKELKLSNKKLRMHIKLILSTLHQTTKKCETYEEFKKFINHIFEEAE